MTHQLPVNEDRPVGARVISDFHRGIAATINEKLPGGAFRYVLDEPHHLGPRHGYITEGTVFTRDGWRILSSVPR